MNVAELGECIASKEGLGPSCWAIAGTLCGGVVRGTAAQKQGTCLRCSVYQDYNRMDGGQGQHVRRTFPREEERYSEVLNNQMNLIHDGLQEEEQS